MKPFIRKPCEECGKLVRITKNITLKTFNGKEVCNPCKLKGKRAELRSIIEPKKVKKKKAKPFKAPEKEREDKRIEKEKTLARMGKPLTLLEKQALFRELRVIHGLSGEEAKERIRELEKEVRANHKLALSRRKL